VSKDKIPLVFFGSGPVSAATLSFLRGIFKIEAVVTKPSTANEMQAAAAGPPVYQVRDRRELTKLVRQKKFASRLGLVVDFGIIIEKPAIDSFPLGIVNSHFSLLPRWRGADPISFAILSGDKKTGVSLMLIDESLDTGDLIAQEPVEIASNATTPELTKKLIAHSNSMLECKLPEYLSGELAPYPQPDAKKATYSRKLQKSDGLVDWNKPAEIIERQIRAFSGWPKSFARIGKHSLIITMAETIAESGKPGEYETGKDNLVVFCGDKALDIKQVQPPGKKEMPIGAFLAGYKL
jgi:methionyl-tRNA formyltransferase